MVTETVSQVEVSTDDVRFLIASGAEYTFKSLVNRLQRDFGLSFEGADSIVWRGAGEFWTINQSTGRISIMCA